MASAGDLCSCKGTKGFCKGMYGCVIVCGLPLIEESV